MKWMQPSSATWQERTVLPNRFHIEYNGFFEICNHYVVGGEGHWFSSPPPTSQAYSFHDSKLATSFSGMLTPNFLPSSTHLPSLTGVVSIEEVSALNDDNISDIGHAGSLQSFRFENTGATRAKKGDSRVTCDTCKFSNRERNEISKQWA
jgi:hypothetical protein